MINCLEFNKVRDIYKFSCVVNGLGVNGTLKEPSSSSTDYKVDTNHRDDFFQSAKRFLPFLEKGDLYPAYAGIRPKLQKAGDSFRDFIIKEEKERGFDNFFNLIGIESPGITASLAIGKYINKLIEVNNCKV